MEKTNEEISDEITILAKGDGFSVVSKQHTPDGNGNPFGTIVGFFQKSDERKQPVWYGRFDGIEEGNGAYKKAIEKSTERGWRIAFRGERLNNPGLS